MTSLWRISNRCELAGLGGEKSDGRWHTAAQGKRIVYLSEHPAVALVEVLANIQSNPRLLPNTYQLMKVAVDESVQIEALPPERLTEPWRDRLPESQSIGDAWLVRCSSALLAVPSVPSPESVNYLLNPRHMDACKIQIEWCKWLKYDKRLFRVTPAVEVQDLK